VPGFESCSTASGAQTAGEFDVVGEAANGEQAVALTAARRPEVVLMDIRMPVLDGLQATRQIVSDPDLAQVRVLILTTFESDEYVFEALRSGASGFVVKDIPPADLLQAIRVVAAGEALLSPGVTRRLISEFVSRVPRPKPS
jgi:DNA-binding NarL/FixJ family response regulator